MIKEVSEEDEDDQNRQSRLLKLSTNQSQSLRKKKHKVADNS